MRVTGTTFDSLIVTTSDSSSTVDVQNSPEIESSTPLAGSFRVKCTDFNGIEHTSNDIAFNTWTQGIDTALQQTIPFLALNIYVRNLYDYDYR